MFCTKCGKETAAGDAFCQYCGAPVRSAGSAGSSPTIRSTMGMTKPVGLTPPGDSPAYAAPRPPVKTDSGKRSKEEYRARVAQTIREQGKSVVFAISIILFTLAVLIQLFEGSTGYLGIVETLTDTFDLPTDVLGDVSRMDSDTELLVSIISMMPQLLTVLALWLLFGGSFSQGSFGVSNAGLIILTVVEIVRIVTISLVGLLCFAVLMPACSTVSQYGSDEVAVMMASLTLGVILGLVLVLVVAGKTLNTLGIIRRSMDTATPNSDVSGFVAVMTMIMGTFSVLGIVSEFDWSALLLGVAQVMLGLQIFFYKSAMSELENDSYMYETSYISRYRAEDPIPTWKQLEMENGFGPGDNY